MDSRTTIRELDELIKRTQSAIVREGAKLTAQSAALRRKATTSPRYAHPAASASQTARCREGQIAHCST